MIEGRFQWKEMRKKLLKDLHNVRNNVTYDHDCKKEISVLIDSIAKAHSKFNGTGKVTDE